MGFEMPSNESKGSNAEGVAESVKTKALDLKHGDVIELFDGPATVESIHAGADGLTILLKGREPIHIDSDDMHSEEYYVLL